MARLEETDRTIDLVTNSHTCKTQEYLMLKEIARSVAVLADEISKPVKPFNVVHKDESSIYPPHDFTIDWDAGYEAACDDIRDFCIEKQHEIVREIENPDTWNKGFLAGLLCIQKEIEEGCFNDESVL